MNTSYTSRAFTMIEMMVSLAISLSVLLMISHFLQQQRHLYDVLSDTSFLEWEIFGHQMDNYTKNEHLKKVEVHRLTSIDQDKKERCYVPYKDQVLRRRGNRGYQPLIFNLKTISFKEANNGVLMMGTFKNGKSYTYTLDWQKAKS